MVPPQLLSASLLSVARQGNPSRFLSVLELAINTHLALAVRGYQDQYEYCKKQLCLALSLSESAIGANQTQQLALIALDLLGRTKLFRINRGCCAWSSPQAQQLHHQCSLSVVLVFFLGYDYTMSRFLYTETELRQLLVTVTPNIEPIRGCPVSPMSSPSSASSHPLSSSLSSPARIETPVCSAPVKASAHPHQDAVFSAAYSYPTLSSNGFAAPSAATIMPLVVVQSQAATLAAVGLLHQPRPLSPTACLMRTPTLITEHPSSGGSSGIASLLPPMDSMTQVHLQPPPNQSQCLLPLAVPSRFPSPPPPTPNAPLVRRRPRPVQPPLPHTLHMSVLASASPAWGAAQEPQVPIVLPTVTPLPSGPEHGDQSMVAFGFGS